MHSLLDLLLADHRRLRSLFLELSRCLKTASSLSEDACFNIFKTFKALAMAHNKAEEYALYALFDIDKKVLDTELQDYVLEGYEEHDLMDKLLKDMGQAEEISPQWKAQFKVVCELMENHFREEEQNFYPKVRAQLAPALMEQLGADYQKERDQIFTKKSGLNIEAAGLFTPETTDSFAGL